MFQNTLKNFAYKLPDGYSTAGGIPICNLVLTLLLSINYLAGYAKYTTTTVY
jgi:hypothetical protein